MTAWRLFARRDGGTVLLALEADEQRQALRRLGYDSARALRVFGFE